MRRIELLFSLLFLLTSGAVFAKTIYSGEFDYKKIAPSSVYFSGRTEAEISKFCDTGEHASNMDLSVCSQRGFEKSSETLTKKLNDIKAKITSNDKKLKLEGEPLALPFFLKSQDAWAQYRDSNCYSDTYMMGEASERYINFWECMTDITRKRITELNELLKK